MRRRGFSAPPLAVIALGVFVVCFAPLALLVHLFRRRWRPRHDVDPWGLGG